MGMAFKTLFGFLFRTLGGSLWVKGIAVFFTIALLAAVFLFGVFWFGYFRGHVTPFDIRTAPLAERAARQFADAIPPYKETGLNPVIVFPLAGPKGARLADIIRDVLDASQLYDVKGKDQVESLLRDMEIDNPPLSEAEAGQYAKRRGAQAFIVGGVNEINARVDPPVLAFHVVFAAVEGGFRWEFDWPPSAPDLAAPDPVSGPDAAPAAGAVKWFFAFLGACAAFMILCLVTPYLLHPLTANLLARDNNAVNALMLLGYALADSAVLRLLLGGGHGGWGTGAVVVGFVAALWLNYHVCSRLERRKD